MVMAIDKSKLTTEQKNRMKSSKIAKHLGDDLYSWCLFIDGRDKYNGMSKSEATWRRNTWIMKGEL
jgi:hypothetical protein